MARAACEARSWSTDAPGAVGAVHSDGTLEAALSTDVPARWILGTGLEALAIASQIAVEVGPVAADVNRGCQTGTDRTQCLRLITSSSRYSFLTS